MLSSWTYLYMPYYHPSTIISQSRTLRNEQITQNQAKNVVQYPVLTGRCATCYTVITAGDNTQTQSPAGLVMTKVGDVPNDAYYSRRTNELKEI